MLNTSNKIILSLRLSGIQVVTTKQDASLILLLVSTYLSKEQAQNAHLQENAYKGT
jgi:hypothetical protein